MEEIIKPYGYIYLTTNLINGKGYIGKHSVPYHDPNYIGSGGKHFWNAVNLYGRDNFITEVLFWCYSEDELNAEEEFLIDFFDCIGSDDFYNEREGGTGGWGKGEHHASYGRVAPNRGTPHTSETKLKISEAMKGNSNKSGKKLSDEQKAHLSEIFKGRKSNFAGKSHTQEAKDKISAKLSGKIVTEETRAKMSDTRKGIPLSEDHKKAISESMKGHKYTNRKYHNICSVCGTEFQSGSARSKYCAKCKQG